MRIGRSRAAAVVLTAVLIIAGCSPPRTPQAVSPQAVDTQPVGPVVPADGYGFGSGATTTWLNAGYVDRELDAVANTRASWLRVLVDWSRIEKKRGQYDWGYFDHVVKAAQSRNLKVLGVITYTADWARPPGAYFTAPPVDPATFAQFAVAVVQRYHDKVSHWEIWNEPNLPLFWGKSDINAAAYAELLKGAYTAIKGAQPDSTVIAAGLSRSLEDGAPPIFLNAMYTAGVKGNFDAAAMHPYVFPGGDLAADPDNGWSDVARVHQVMADHGDGDKKIWMTEFGAPTSAPTAEGVSQQEQARQITEILAAAAATGYSGPAFIYSIRDIDSPDQSDREDNFGALLTSDWQPKFTASVLTR